MALHRIRSRDKYRVMTLTKALNASGVPLASGTYPSQRATESMDDWYLPGFNNMMLTGFQPVTPLDGKLTLAAASRIGFAARYSELRRFIPPVFPLTYICTTDEEPLGSVGFKYSNPFPPSITVNGCGTQFLTAAWSINWPNPTVNMPNLIDMISEAKSAVLTRAGRSENGFGEPLAEIRETIQLIRNPLKSLKRVMRTFSRKAENSNFRTSKHQARALANLWAESSWAALPLVRTADDALQALADGFHRRYAPAYQRVTVKREAGGFSSVASEGDYTFTYSGLSAQHWIPMRRVSKRVSYVVKAGVNVIHNDNGSVSSLLGLRGRDIPGVLWEIFPLSFLVDRVVNISACLQAASNFMSTHVSFEGGWTSYRSTTTVTKLLDNIYPLGAPTNQWVLPPKTKPWVNTVFRYDRSQWTPSIRDVSPPKLAGQLTSSLKNLVDLTAVIALKTERLPGYKTLEQSTLDSVRSTVRGLNR